MHPSSTDPTRHTLLRAVASVTVVAGLALAAPFIWRAAEAGAGLLVLGGLGVLTAAALRLLPVLGQRLENRLLAARKAEARAHPLEQLEAFLLARSAQVAAFGQQVGAIDAQVRALEEMLRERRRLKPQLDLGPQERSLAEMQRGHAVLVARYLGAERALGELRAAVDDKRFEWRFGVAGQEALRCLGSTTGEQVLGALLADEAFTTIRENFHRAFAALELEAKRLEASSS